MNLLLNKRLGTVFAAFAVAAAILFTGYSLQSKARTAVLERVVLDNLYIQRYRGRLGVWHVNLNEPLTRLARKMGVTTAEVRRINGGKTSGTLFVPMGIRYYHEMIERGHGRRVLHVDSRQMVWPVEKVSYTSRFGPRAGGMHAGLDIGCGRGTPVLAAEAGVVSHSAWFGALGNAIAVYHKKSGLRTWYGHNTTVLLKVGEKVEKGQILAFSGTTGRSTGPHVHFEVRYNQIALNPEDFIEPTFRNPSLVLREESPLDIHEVTTFNLYRDTPRP